MKTFSTLVTSRSLFTRTALGCTLFISSAGLFAACEPAADTDTESEETGASEQELRACPDPKEMAAAGGCPDCTVQTPVRLSLPLTGVKACSAKLLDRDGEGGVVTMLRDGTVTEEARLFEAERALYRKLHGALTPELADVIDTLPGDTMVNLWIWAKVTLEYPAKEALIADPALAARFAEHARSASRAATGPLIQALERGGHTLLEGDGNDPLIRAVVPASEVRALARMPEALSIGSDDWPGQPLTTAWWDSIRMTTAQGMTTGTGQNVCVIEGGRPDDVSQLTLAELAAPAGGTSWHSRWVTGIIRNTGTLDVAPNASIYIGNWPGYTGDQPSMAAWCANRGARTVNFSHTFTSGHPGGISGTDMQFDYFTKLSPFPLFVPAAGNWGCVAGQDTVVNRGHNSLVIGGSNDLGDTDVTNDTIYDCSSFRNPTSDHSDRELPYAVAPAVNVDSVGLVATGTSGSAPMATGTVALMAARDPWFNTWPEMKRAAILATSLRNVDASAFGSLPGSDLKDGVGLLNGAFAADIASMANKRGPGTTAAPAGHDGKTLSFTSDFPSGSISSSVYNIQAVPGFFGGPLRVRAAIAWDSSPTCTANGNSCTADALDADLDLLIFDSAGNQVCSSGSYDSSWEACDFAATTNGNYTLKIKKYGTVTASTYIGVAWYTYTPGLM